MYFIFVEDVAFSVERRAGRLLGSCRASKRNPGVSEVFLGIEVDVLHGSCESLSVTSNISLGSGQRRGGGGAHYVPS